MLKIFKSALKIFFSIALIMQLAGCHDHDWHHDRSQNYGPSVGVHVHG